MIELRDGSPEVTELTFTSPPGHREVQQKDLRAVDVDRIAIDLYASAAASSAPESDEYEQAVRMAEVAKALGDPIRLQLVDVLRKHAGKVCVCELVPLFDISQPTLSHHLKKLREAGIVDSERRGLWAYYYVLPDALKELSAWLT